MICPNCGLENGKRNVCRKCGTFLNNKQTQRVTDPKELKAMRRARNITLAKGCGTTFLLMIVAFVVISVLLFGILYLLTKNMKWPTQEQLASEMSAVAEHQRQQAASEAPPEGTPQVTITQAP